MMTKLNKDNSTMYSIILEQLDLLHREMFLEVTQEMEERMYEELFEDYHPCPRNRRISREKFKDWLLREAEYTIMLEELEDF